ncbi:hypothetical protein [Krasilnikovia sp. MM14-A1259]|uniref:hypothetical protein n=1 Tax=Krasilnikovia sp. MM14-A1259 TaxID=3373539 RepID=UPI0038155BC9
MRSTISSRCARRQSRHPDDLTAWAADLVANPGRYGADEQTRVIVAKLLAKIGAAR